MKMGNVKASRSRKRRFHGNRFTEQGSESSQNEPSSDVDQPAECAARKCSSDKLQDLSFEMWDQQSSSSDSDEESDEETQHETHPDAGDFSGTGYRLVSLVLLFAAISTFSSCKSCKVGDVVVSEGTRNGLAPSIIFTCTECPAQLSLSLSPKLPGCFFEINRLAVFGMRLIGRGRQALVKLCAALNMPNPMSRSSFSGHQTALNDAAEQIAERSMNAASSAVQAAAGQDIAVSADGTWMRRGFSSLYGAMSVIAWETGRVLDVYVLSRFCSSCSKKQCERRAGKLTAEDHEAWKAQHKPNCSANYSGSAPAMESVAAVKMWSRSVEKRNL